MKNKMYKSFIGDTFYEIFIPEKNNKVAIIIAAGLPSMPRTLDLIEGLTSKGYIVLQPRYIGSWESKGKFSDDNCIKTINDSLNVLKKRVVIDASFKKEIKLNIDRIFLVGSSFGGSVVLSLKDVNDLAGIISIAPVIDFKGGSYENASLDYLPNFMRDAYSQVYRPNEKNFFNDLIKGKTKINPIDNIDNIKGLNILFIHSKGDKSLDFRNTFNFFEKVKDQNNAQIEILEGFNHGSETRIESVKKINLWIKNNGSTVITTNNRR